MVRFVLLMAFAARAWACSCSGTTPSVKEAWQQASYVFLGKVESAFPNDGESGMQPQTARIRVEETFKGVTKGQVLEMRSHGTSCDHVYRTGSRAVYYMFTNRETGKHYLPVCSRSMGSADSENDDLLFLRGLPRTAVGTRLSGTVYGHRPKLEVANVRVTITGAKGFTLTTRTNSAGVYELYGLPAGRYSVRIEPPRGSKVGDGYVSGSPTVPDDPSAVELKKDGAAHVDFQLGADTRLSGRVLDAQGKALKGVCVHLETEQGEKENSGWSSDCTEANGDYSISTVAPGKYRLVVREEVKVGRIKSESTLYYPGVRSREQAELIAVEAGLPMELMDIRLPSDEKRFKIEGKFLYADGVPVATGMVTFHSPRHGYKAMATTLADGWFALQVIPGMVGELIGGVSFLEHRMKACPWIVGERRGIFVKLTAPTLHIQADEDQSDIRLELGSPSCNEATLR